MSIITIDLLDALLSVGEQRGQAEAHLQSLATMDRVKGLLSILFELRNEGHVMLAAVLLRRDIAALAGDALVNKIDPNIAVNLLKEMVDPLSKLFLNTQMPDNCRRQLGHCLPEVCSSLSLLSEVDCDAALKTILDTIAPPVREMNVMLEIYLILSSLC